METVVQSPAVSRLFTSYVASVKIRRRVATAKINAKKVYQAMRSWQVAGQVIFALKNVAFQARPSVALACSSQSISNPSGTKATEILEGMFSAFARTTGTDFSALGAS
eukprot:g11517.t1